MGTRNHGILGFVGQAWLLIFAPSFPSSAASGLRPSGGTDQEEGPPTRDILKVMSRVSFKIMGIFAFLILEDPIFGTNKTRQLYPPRGPLLSDPHPQMQSAELPLLMAQSSVRIQMECCIIFPRIKAGPRFDAWRWMLEGLPHGAAGNLARLASVSAQGTVCFWRR